MFAIGKRSIWPLEIVITLARILLSSGNRLHHDMTINDSAHYIPKFR
jgi:hypothetical protein